MKQCWLYWSSFFKNCKNSKNYHRKEMHSRFSQLCVKYSIFNSKYIKIVLVLSKLMCFSTLKARKSVILLFSAKWQKCSRIKKHHRVHFKYKQETIAAGKILEALEVVAHYCRLITTLLRPMTLKKILDCLLVTKEVGRE